MKSFNTLREETTQETYFAFSEDEWNSLSEEEKDEYLDIEEDIEGEFEAENGDAIWVIGGEEYVLVSDEDIEEARGFNGRSKRQVHKTQLKKRRNRGRNRREKMKMKIKRRKSSFKVKRKRLEKKRHRKFGGGDMSGKSGKMGAARKRRGGRSISYKG